MQQVADRDVQGDPFFEEEMVNQRPNGRVSN